MGAIFMKFGRAPTTQTIDLRPLNLIYVQAYVYSTPTPMLRLPHQTALEQDNPGISPEKLRDTLPTKPEMVYLLNICAPAITGE